MADEGYDDSLVDEEDLRRRRPLDDSGENAPVAYDQPAGDDASAPAALPEVLPPPQEDQPFEGGQDQDYNAPAEGGDSIIKQLMDYLYDKHGVHEAAGEPLGEPDESEHEPAGYIEPHEALDKTRRAIGLVGLEQPPEEHEPAGPPEQGDGSKPDEALPSGMDIAGDQGRPDTSMGGMLKDAITAPADKMAGMVRGIGTGLSSAPGDWLEAGGNAIKHGLARYMGREDALNAEELRAAEKAVELSKSIAPEGYRPDYDPGAVRMNAGPTGEGKAERESIPERAARERTGEGAGIMTDKERNTEALRQIAQTKGLDTAAAALQRYAKEYDVDRTHAAAALNHGDVDSAAKLFNEAFKKVPNGKDVFAVPNGKGVTMVSTDLATGQSKSTQLSLPQFHDVLRGPVGQWDHVATRDFDKDLAGVRGVDGRPLEPVSPEVAQMLREKMGPNTKMDPTTGRLSEQIQNEIAWGKQDLAKTAEGINKTMTPEQYHAQQGDILKAADYFNRPKPAQEVDWRVADVRRKAESAARASDDQQFKALVTHANKLIGEGKEVPQDIQQLIAKKTSEQLHKGTGGAAAAGAAPKPGEGEGRWGQLGDKLVWIPAAAAGGAAAGAAQITGSSTRESTKGAGGTQHSISAADHFAAAGVPMGRDANGDLIRSSGAERSRQIAQEDQHASEMAAKAADRRLKQEQLAMQNQHHQDKMAMEATRLRQRGSGGGGSRSSGSSLHRGGGQQRRHQ